MGKTKHSILSKVLVILIFTSLITISGLTTVVSNTEGHILSDYTGLTKIEKTDQLTLIKPKPSPDTTPPAAITGLTATDAGTGGTIYLSWNPNVDSDFAHYNIYQNTSTITDVTGMTPINNSITNNATNTYQVTGLTDGTIYYFAVTAVDTSGNENKSVTDTSDTPTLKPTITEVTHDATGTLAPYDVLTVTLKGDEGLTATFDIGTILTGVSMTEGVGLNKGTYTGEYTIKTTDASGTYTVTGYLDSGTGIASMDASTQVTIDTTPPTISDVQSTSITGSSATITWTTDEASDSLVEYGTTSGSYTGSVSNATLVTSHSIDLTGLSGGTKYYYKVTSRDAVSNQGTSGEYNFTTTGSSFTLLLVDDDDAKTYETSYQNALNANGYTYDNWCVSTDGSPSSTTLSSYDIVIWFTADDYGAGPSTLSATDQTNLATYLDGGGKLFITGQDIGYDLGTNTFYNNYLHASYVADNSGGTTIDGVTGDPISDGFTGISITGSYPDDISLKDSYAETIFYYGGTTKIAGLKADTGVNRVVYISCMYFEGSDTAANKATIMNNIINWLNSPPDLTPPTFDGIQFVNDTVYSGILNLTWNEASDPSTPITYHIYQATTSGGQNFATPTYTTTNTNYQVSGLTNGQPYYFVVRAEDKVGNEDTNTVEKSATPTGTEVGAKKYAVIVGISDYKSISDLSYCDEDANDWYYYLTNSKTSSSSAEGDFLYSLGETFDYIWVYGDSTSSYAQYDGLATEANIKAAIANMVSLASSTDLIFFAFSGHGSGSSTTECELCCWDNGAGESGEDGALYDGELKALFEPAVAERIFIFLDSCMSGGMDGVMINANSANVYLTTTCNADGYGYDYSAAANGAFTEFFLNKGLRNGESGNPGNQYMEANFVWVAANYPYSGNDAPCEFDGDTDKLFYLKD